MRRCSVSWPWRIGGSPTSKAAARSVNLGDTTGAMESYLKSLAILEALLRRDPDDPATRRDVAHVSTDLAYTVWETGDIAGALEHARHAQALFEPLVASSPPDMDLRLRRWCTLTRWA